VDSTYSLKTIQKEKNLYKLNLLSAFCEEWSALAARETNFTQYKAKTIYSVSILGRKARGKETIRNTKM
jgi:hypothetical protein